MPHLLLYEYIIHFYNFEKENTHRNTSELRTFYTMSDTFSSSRVTDMWLMYRQHPYTPSKRLSLM